MNKLILDYSKWRCGKDGENSLGEGSTLLLNDEGFFCCLGLFSPQLNPDITEAELIGTGEPGDLATLVPLLNQEWDDGENDLVSTGLSEAAIEINDDDQSTPEKKIAQLKELFAPVGYEIEVINQPKTV